MRASRDAVESFTAAAGEEFGALAVLDERPRPFTATTRSHVEVLRIGAEDFLYLLEQHSALARGVIRHLAGEIRSTIGEGDGGVAHGGLLSAFAEAVVEQREDLEAIRSELLAVLGPAAFVEAAATVGIFNGLVRTADSTGIPLDPKTVDRAAKAREELGLNEYRGAVSSGVRSGLA